MDAVIRELGIEYLSDRDACITDSELSGGTVTHTLPFLHPATGMCFPILTPCCIIGTYSEQNCRRYSDDKKGGTNEREIKQNNRRNHGPAIRL